MRPPTTEQIINEAIKIYFQKNREVDCYNTPEINELKESGIYQEARKNLMIVDKLREGLYCKHGHTKKEHPNCFNNKKDRGDKE